MLGLIGDARMTGAIWSFARQFLRTESGRLVRGMSHRVDPAAITEEARTTRLDAVLGPPDSPFRWGIVQRQKPGSRPQIAAYL